MRLLDCTLRDGANIVGKGFSAELTKSMIEGLINNGITFIEYGNAYGIGSYENANSIAPLTDVEYLDLGEPYFGKAEIGMFMGAKNASEKYISLAASKGLHFLRIGENAGDGKDTYETIKSIKKHGMKAYYSMMKGYVLSAKDLAVEAHNLEECGLDGITIMDSAGTMFPEQVKEYITEMHTKVRIEVGFHGHNNRGLSVANGLAATQAGADWLDCGLMGMARSAGNLSTELAVTILQHFGKGKNIDFYGLLHYIDNELIPLMKQYDFKDPIKPADIILGVAGCHSNFLPLFRNVAENKKVDLYRLIVEVSKSNQKNPDRQLIETIADQLKEKVWIA